MFIFLTNIIVADVCCRLKLVVLLLQALRYFEVSDQVWPDQIRALWSYIWSELSSLIWSNRSLWSLLRTVRSSLTRSNHALWSLLRCARSSLTRSNHALWSLLRSARSSLIRSSHVLWSYFLRCAQSSLTRSNRAAPPSRGWPRWRRRAPTVLPQSPPAPPARRGRRECGTGEGGR